MLSVEVFPGRSIGPFFLGISISDAIQFIQQKYKIISHANLIYNETDPLGSDIILDLNEDGMRLKFEPSSQKLRVMEVYDLSKVTLSYAGMVFCSPEKVPSLVCIADVFGPTHPGEFDTNSSVYSLHYPGLSFSFPIPDKYRSLYADTANGIPPMEFPDGITPVASRLYLYIGSIKNPQLPLPQTNSLYFEKVAVKMDEGILFTWRDEKLDFTSSTQDVLSILGPPTRVFFKEEDKMKIHTVTYTGLGCADYFYNYFSLGIDILFDIDSHLVKKFILHTNFPNHHTFNQYVKCNFHIEVNDFVITADSKWGDIQQAMGPCGKPVIHHRGSNSSPFGPTLSYGYQNAIFEVMQNNHIASVCIFCTPHK